MPSIRAADAGTDGVSTGGTAVDEREEGTAVGQFFPEVAAQAAQALVACRQHHAHLARDTGGDDAPQGMHQDRFAAERHSRFGHAVAEPLPGTGGHQDDRGDRGRWFAHAD